jgi:peptide/nickel transport system substrate-binding protein
MTSWRAWAPVAANGALALASLLTGCAPRRPAPATGVLRVAEEQSTSFVRNFNPLNYAGDVRWPARHSMYEPLLIYNPQTAELVPWLATRYAWSDGGLRLQLSLRPGVRWSDGTPFDARDVVFTFDLLARHRELDAHGLWRHTRSVTARDATTVDVTLDRRHVPVLEALADQPIVPAHIWATIADPVAFTDEDPVATGPFVRVSSFGSQSYQIERNPDYWRGMPAVQALRFAAYAGNEQTLLALLGDELDWAGELVPAVERIYVRRDPAHHRYWFPLLDGTVFLYANTRRPPLDVVAVRKALSLAIDRDRLVQVAMHGYTRSADGTGLGDAHARFRDPAAVARGSEWMAFNPGRAGRMLDEAGWRRGPDGRRRGPDGSLLVLPIAVPAGYSDWVATAQMVARGLRRIGVEAPVVTADFQAWFERLQQGDFMLLVGRSEVSATPYGFYHALMSSESVRPLGENAPENWHRFGLPAADVLLATLEETSDPDEQRRASASLEMLFAEHAPAIPLFLGPLWGEYNAARFSGFPDADNPYAPLSPYLEPQSLLVLTRIFPR